MSEVQITRIDPNMADPATLCAAEVAGSVWGTSEAARAIRSLSAEHVIALSASIPEGSRRRIGHGFLIGRHRLPAAAVDSFGISALQYPRLVLLVHPNYREDGVGSSLLREIERIAKERCLGQLDVAVEEEFKDFFTKRGYTGLSPRTSYWFQDARLWLLRQDD